MAKSDYIKTNDKDFNGQLKTFKGSIGSYAAVLSVTADQITGQSADADYMDYILRCTDIMGNTGQQWTSWKNLTRGGGTPPVDGAPVPPALPDPVTPVAPGIEVRFRALVQQLKVHHNYNESIGIALGVEGAEQTGPDLSAIQPAIDAILSGNHVLLKWGWGGNRAYLDLCELQVDRNDGKGFVLLAFDTTPNYNDTQPFPATPTKWTYRAIYRVGDAQVGQWSLSVSVTVGN